jgi:uncharacterized protein VirK/YbjX
MSQINCLSHLDDFDPNELFRLTDDGAGGRLQTFKRWLKFRLRYWLCEAQLKQIFAFFQSHGIADVMLMDMPILFRPKRPYLWSGLNPDLRTAGLLAHFGWLLSRHTAQTVCDFYARGEQRYFSQTFPEGEVCLALEPARGLGREGELAFHLKLNNVSLMRAAFSILPAHMVGIESPGLVMVIGNMQGTKHLNQEIKIVTQRMERTRPQNILMTALQGLATGWQLVGMVGVSNSSHVYSGYRSLSQRVGQSYDSLWQELGTSGAVTAAHWRLPIQWVARSEQDVPSNKRSQLRRKNEIRQKIFDDVIRNSATL